jgi:VWFA-related protein
MKLSRRSFHSLALAAPILSQKLWAQQATPTAADDAATIKVDVKYVIAPVTVVDRQGRFVTGLTPLDFRLYDNGRLQVITEDQATHPISLAVAIQSNSTVEKILPQIQKTASLYDSLVLGDTGEIAIIGFDHRVQRLTQGFTSDPAKIQEAFKKLKPGSSSARLNDAAMDAINMLRNRPTTRKRILLLISESRDGGSELHVRDVMTAAEFANVVVYSVDISHLLTSLTSKAEPNRPSPVPIATRQLPGGNINTPTIDTQMNMGNYMPAFKEIFTATKAIFIKNPLEVYTKYSGGREYSFMTQRGIDQAISDIGQELHSQYLLTYSPNNQTEAGFHEIVVQIALPDMKVRTRNGYWLAAKPE